MTLEKRAEPSPTKPPLDPKTEAELAEIEEKTAQCYIDAEEMTYRMQRAADKILNYVPRYVPESASDAARKINGLNDLNDREAIDNSDDDR